MEYNTNLYILFGEKNKNAEKVLYTFVYQRLKDIARVQKQRHPNSSKDIIEDQEKTTALVHEAYLKMTHFPREELNSKRDFYLAIATLINQVLSDISRKKTAKKRDSTVGVFNSATNDELSFMEVSLSIEKLLLKLESNYSRQVEIFKLKQLVGLSTKELTELYKCSDSLIEKDLLFVRRWLKSKLHTSSHNEFETISNM